MTVDGNLPPPSNSIWESLAQAILAPYCTMTRSETLSKSHRAFDVVNSHIMSTDRHDEVELPFSVLMRIGYFSLTLEKKENEFLHCLD
jgi:hypothetical protein